MDQADNAPPNAVIAMRRSIGDPWTFWALRQTDELSELASLDEQDLVVRLSKDRLKREIYEHTLVLDVGWLIDKPHAQRQRILDGFSALPQGAQDETLRRLALMLSIKAAVAHGISIREAAANAISVVGPDEPSSLGLSTVMSWWRAFRDDRESLISIAPRIDLAGNRKGRLDAVAYTRMDEVLEARQAMGAGASVGYTFRESGLRNHVSLSTFKRRHAKTYTPHEHRAAQFGERNADDMFRVNAPVKETKLPLECAEIDHHQCGIYVRLSPTLVAKPWITVVLDRHTRMVLGVHFTLARPSFNSVRWALIHMALPKKTDSLGLKTEWPCWGVPTDIVSDKGAEFIGKEKNEVEKHLGFSFHVLPAGEPRLKGRIERFFGTLDRQAFAKEKGRDLRKGERPGVRQPWKEADKSFGQIKQIVLEWIVDKYQVHRHEGIHTSPLQLWNEKIADVDPALTRSRDDIAVLFDRNENPCKIGKEGLKVGKALYFSYQLQSLVRTYGYGKSYRVRSCLVDPNHVLFQHPDKKVWYGAERKPQVDFAGTKVAASLNVTTGKGPQRHRETQFPAELELEDMQAAALSMGFFTPIPIFSDGPITSAPPRAPRAASERQRRPLAAHALSSQPPAAMTAPQALQSRKKASGRHRDGQETLERRKALRNAIKILD